MKKKMHLIQSEMMKPLVHASNFVTNSRLNRGVYSQHGMSNYRKKKCNLISYQIIPFQGSYTYLDLIVISMYYRNGFD